MASYMKVVQEQLLHYFSLKDLAINCTYVVKHMCMNSM